MTQLTANVLPYVFYQIFNFKISLSQAIKVKSMVSHIIIIYNTDIISTQMMVLNTRHKNDKNRVPVFTVARVE